MVQELHIIIIYVFTASVTGGFMHSSTDKRTISFGIKIIQRPPTYLRAMTVHNDNSIDSLTSLAQIPAR